MYKIENSQMEDLNIYIESTIIIKKLWDIFPFLVLNMHYPKICQPVLLKTGQNSTTSTGWEE